MKLNSNEFQLKKLRRICKQVEDLADKYREYTDDELKAETPKLQGMLKDGKTLDDILPEAFAVARETDQRVLGMFPYPVQVLGGIVLHQGNLAQMRTGEGKTLTETMPVYLNALNGKGVHIITVNEYLSERDAEEMGRVFRWLGLTVGFNNSKSSGQEKKKAYRADITYSTNSELAFDYLRDNMCGSAEDQVQRGLNYCIIDEADSILIDEARTPLIIAGADQSYDELYTQADKLVKSLDEDDYKYDVSSKAISLLPSGIEKANNFFGVENIYDSVDVILTHYIKEALKANFTMELGKDYIIKDGEILIVDTFTGRAMPGRRFSDGLHQAIEAKEGVKIKESSTTDASITYQNFFRMYNKISGMSGTAKSQANEIYETYHMQVIVIPTNRKIQRIDYPDRLYVTREAKNQAVIKEIKRVHVTGQPLLIGTSSVDSSEEISELLDEEGISHEVLNAKNDKAEADIVAKAGHRGAVTVATNMAGRGTDIKLSKEILDLGGLYVLGTERSESLRIDDQLRGRAGRQGDKGVSVFYTSLEDDLILRYGTDHLQDVKEKLIKKGKEFEPITNPLIRYEYVSAQQRVEANNYEQRIDTLHYDDIVREQRDAIYRERNKVIHLKDDIKPYLVGMCGRAINRLVNFCITEKDKKKVVNTDKLRKMALPNFGLELNEEDLKGKTPLELKQYLLSLCVDTLNEKADLLDSNEQMNEFGKLIILTTIDNHWKVHINELDQLRLAINLRSFGQYNPLVEYQRTSYELYQRMIRSIERDAAYQLNKAEIVQSKSDNEREQLDA